MGPDGQVAPSAGAATKGAVEEVSAGGLVVDRSGPQPQVALIARRSRGGRLQWSMPKGHVEPGESVQDAAVREVAEETGIHGRVLGPLGTIDFWFSSGGRRVHKTVHHYLLEASGGRLSDADVEVTKVAWVPLGQARRRLSFSDEQQLLDRVGALLADTA